jgi:hypothetical protein
MEATTADLSSKLHTTSLSSNAVPSTKPPSSNKPTFSTLPPRIRHKIYAHILDTELVNLGITENVSYTHKIQANGLLHVSASRSPFPGLSTSLFRVNKHIGSEAQHYFYSKNLFVRFAIHTADARHAKTMLEDSGVLFSVASPEKVAQCTRHAMDVSIFEKNSMQMRAVILFPAQYLPRMINFLDQASRAATTWAPNHALHIKVLNTYGFPLARLQGDLLELFRLLANLGAADIDSENLLPAYAEGLQANMLASEFTAEGFLETVTTLADRAEEEAQRTGNAALAAQLAQSCVIALTYAYLTRAEVLHTVPEGFMRKVQRLRWRCEICMGKALLRTHQADVVGGGKWPSSTTLSSEKKMEIAKDLLAAETAASQALSLATDSPNPASNPWFQSLPAEVIPPNKAEWFTDEERGTSWYVCGLVHTALGEHLFAAGDLERACGLFPGGEGFEKAFEVAREAIDWKVKPGTGMKSAARIAKG